MTMKPRWDVFCRTRSRFQTSAGGNMGVRRRQLHTMLERPDYEPLLASGAA